MRCKVKFIAGELCQCQAGFRSHCVICEMTHRHQHQTTTWAIELTPGGSSSLLSELQFNTLSMKGPSQCVRANDGSAFAKTRVNEATSLTSGHCISVSREENNRTPVEIGVCWATIFLDLLPYTRYSTLFSFYIAQEGIITAFKKPFSFSLAFSLSTMILSNDTCMRIPKVLILLPSSSRMKEMR